MDITYYVTDTNERFRDLDLIISVVANGSLWVVFSKYIIVSIDRRVSGVYDL